MRFNRILAVALTTGLMSEILPKKDAILLDDNPHVPHSDHSPVVPVQELVISNTSSYSPLLDLAAMHEANQSVLEFIAKDPAAFQRMIDRQK